MLHKSLYIFIFLYIHAGSGSDLCINTTTDYQQVIKLYENLAPPFAVVTLTPMFGISSTYMVTGPADLELYTNNNDSVVTIYSNTSFTYSNGTILNITYVEKIEIDGTPCVNTIFLVIEILQDIPPNCTIQYMLPCSIGDPVVDFQCNSTDHPQLGNVTYSITDSRYEINEVNNEVVIIQPIMAGNHSIFLTACGGGVIPKCANYSITFTLPKLLYFPNKTYHITVGDILQEGMLLPDGALVCTELPICNDSMESIQYNVSIDNGPFSVFENGSIYVTNRIDYSTNNRYNLSIRCNNSLSEDSAIVSISNRRFAFLNATYFKVLPENVSSAEVFLNVTLRWHPTLTNVTYNISDSLFSIDSRGGVSVTSMPLDFETAKYLNVTVNATALYAKATTTIIINVTDINDNRPDFDTTSLLETTISIAETLGSIVFNISATDNDAGVNQEITYTIEHNDVVGIYSNNGSIYVNTSTLECYAGMDYILTVTATDSGEPALSDTVNITIKIEPLNILFNASLFTFNITENTAIPTVVGYLNASVYTAAGVDDGGLLSYSISSDYFYVDSVSSILHVSSAIDRELTPSYNFSVMASLQCPNGVTTTNQSQVSIFVTDENDNRPAFNVSSTNLIIGQDVTPGSILYNAVAVDSEDIGRNSQISNYYISRSFNDLFQIDSISGNISGNISITAIPTEYRDYLFDVFAEDNGIPSLTSYPLSISVSGLIRNESQNVHFEKDLYIFSVAENASINSSIGKIKLVYNQNPGPVLLTCFNCENFTINSTSMEIYTTVSYDREQQSLYAFYVTASVEDFEIAQTTVSVVVTDINDNIPMFSHSSYTRAISSDAIIGTVALKVSATDNDIHENSDISYSLYPNNTGFGINTDGSIVTQYNQLRENNTYNFHVVATDKGINPQLSSSALVRITVYDDQNNFPFNGSSYQFGIEENSTLGSTVGSIYTSPNFTYQLVHNSNDSRNCFNLTNGTISITCEADREMVDFYYFQIKAISNDVTSFANVMVMITDLNDNPPIFEQSTYSTAISNSLPASTIIATVKATDIDVNSTIQYYHNGPDTYFKVNWSTGELTFNETNIRSLRGLYSSSIVASDGMLNSTVDYTIFIPSFNEALLEFDQSQYVFNLTENSDILTTLGTLVLNYKNNLINEHDLIAPLSFEITDVTTNKTSGLDFHIDQAGELLALVKIDREVQDFYNFTVTGYYGNTFKLTAETSVLITIQDINDVTPRFNQTVYFSEVNNIINNGDTLLTVTAYDNDYQENGMIVYAIRDSVYVPSARADVDDNLTTEFAINATSGEISLQSSYHPSGQYRLTVGASDRSTVPLTSTALVLINLFDAIPSNISFTTQNYTFSVAENVSLLTHIGNVSVKEMNNPALQGIHYNITGGNGSNVFFIDPFSGVIVNAAFLDRETNPYYMLRVTATAVGKSDIEPSTVSVFISLEDVNDEVPSFSKQVFNVSRSSTESNSTIIRTTATDKDVGNNAKLTYTIVSGGNNNFTIDNTTGVVYANGIDIPAGVYPLRVSVADHGLMPHTSIALALVTIYHIPPDNISFPQPQYVFNITENSQLLTIVGNISILEMNHPGIIIGNIKYGITGGNGSEAFVISSTGTISNIVITDRETFSSYTLTIEATVVDIPDIQTAYTDVIINVIDVNDEIPVFDQSIYRANFNRNVTASFSVITLSAYDADIGSNARITYSILNNNQLFQINNMTGEIQTTASLILESSYMLHVEAIDQGIRPNTGTTIMLVSITLPDITKLNFSQVSYTFNVNETASLGTYLGSVTLNRHHGFVIENVMYSINSTVIAVDYNGNLYTRQELDYENTSQYCIMMTAVLHVNNTNLTASTLTMINVTDVNDNAPVFTNVSYTTAIKEGSNNGTTVLQVEASDADFGHFGRLNFSITGEHFGITPTGMVFVKGTIDHERTDLYKLLITAEDGEGLRANAILTINILDINDSPPMLLTSNEECFVYERTENSSACSLIFTDHDLGENGLVRITNVSGGGFRYDTRHVQSNVFTLLVLSALDYETISSINITVQFEDKGVRPNSNNKSLTIQVIDEPDNAPVFVNGSSQQVDVRTIVTNGSRIFTILATDTDNDEIVYDIVKVDPVNVFGRFYITPFTGAVLIVAPDPPFISDSIVTLTISATDNSVYNLSSQSNISISIIPNTLSFTRLDYEFTLTEEMGAGTMVGIIQIDRDSQATDIELRIVPSDVPFDITPNSGENNRVLTGTIRTTEEIDRDDNEQNNQFIFSVIAQRSAVSETATATVVINIQDINDNSPTYTGSTQLSIDENAESLTVVTTISATDQDLGENGRISGYTLLNNNQNFIINNQGVLQSNAEFDYEITQSYDITIEISDGGQPSGTARYDFTVDVNNLNDNPPMINHTMYFADIKEGETPGHILLNVIIEDRDSDPFSIRQPPLVTGSAPLRLFVDDRNRVGSSYPIVLSFISSAPDSAVYSFNLQATDGNTVASATLYVGVFKQIHFFQFVLDDIPEINEFAGRIIGIVQQSLFSVYGSRSSGLNVYLYSIEPSGDGKATM